MTWKSKRRTPISPSPSLLAPAKRPRYELQTEEEETKPQIVLTRSEDKSPPDELAKWHDGSSYPDETECGRSVDQVFDVLADPDESVMIQPEQEKTG